jgi:hypothetical protein
LFVSIITLTFFLYNIKDLTFLRRKGKDFGHIIALPKMKSSFACSVILGFVSVYTTTAQDIVAQFVTFPGFQCNSGGAGFEVDAGAVGQTITIPGAGAALLQGIQSGCVVGMCFAGDNCDIREALEANVCVLATGDEGVTLTVWDKFVVTC